MGDWLKGMVGRRQLWPGLMWLLIEGGAGHDIGCEDGQGGRRKVEKERRERGTGGEVAGGEEVGVGCDKGSCRADDGG